MAIFEIPLDNLDPAFTFSVDLDGETYNFKFRWNGRMETWKFDLLDSALEPIVYGIPFYSSLDLLAQIVLPNRPPGVLFALNFAQAGLSADRFSIGGDVKFFYREAE